MLTALNQDGKYITLVHSFYNKELLERLRSNVYFCPQCHEPLILKAGEIRIPHFSHRKHSLCTTSQSEPESIQHLQGKKYLYNFLTQQGLSVTIEHYFPDIKQRADLFVQTYSHSYAIEYQCSPLARSLLEERTKGYKSIGIVPLWIMGGKPYQKMQKGLFSLSDFHWSMIRQKKGYGHHLLSFDSESMRFYLLSQITSISSKIVSATLTSRTISTATLPLHFPISKTRMKHLTWLQHKRKWLQNKVQYGNLVHDHFLKTIYSSGNNPFLLPPICGLPVPHMECFYSHPLEWQFLIFQECLSKLQIGTRVSLKYINQKMEAGIKSGFINPRFFPLDREITWRNAVENYFSLLTEMEYFTKLGEDLFKMNKQVKIPMSIEEGMQWEEAIFRKINDRNSSLAKIDESCFFFEGLAGFTKIK
ncbi:competence protein CoiA [Lederbergia panacisoli]|uniref:competence protein CoiA n=1 Tax=Lederbergia panacisoli TaxID=1255251 RepID=UPI00214BD314|nr:competence protein CoiA family protein [Lederbergia panacisoli]MCR2820985.1 competence protein CoiA family protein [Lederbergia panacisoli]